MKNIITTLCLFIAQLSFSQNIIQNGNFENGYINWTLINTDVGASVNIDNSIFFQGNNSMKLEINNQNSGITSGIFQSQTVLPNKTYLFSYAIKTNGVDLMAFPFFQFGNGTDYFIHTSFVSGRTKDWTTYNMRITTPPSVNTLDFFILLTGNIGTVWVDEIILSELTPTNQINFTVDFNTVTNTFNSKLLSTNSSPIRPNSANDFTLQFQEIGINEVRTHDIYNSCDIHIIFPDFSADPLDPNSYDFTTTDYVIQSIINAGAIPFFRLGYSFEANPIHNIPPTNFDKWATICLQIVKHYNAGWNNGFNYNIEKWEIWNEPDLDFFWSGTPQQFYDLYKKTAIKIKNYDSNLKIGAAGFANMNNTKFIDSFLDSINTNNIPFDFISYHSYTFSNPYYFLIQQQDIQPLLLFYGLSNIETYLTEWSNYPYNTETTLTDFGRDDALSASLTASSFFYLQNSSLTAAHRYRTDEYFFGLFRDNGDYSYSGQAFKAVGNFNENNQWLQTTGSDTLGTVCMAGKSNSNNKFSIIVSNPSKISNSYSVDIQNLLGNYNYQILRIDSNNELVLVQNGVVSPSSSTITSIVSPPYVDYITFNNILGINISNLTEEDIILYPNPFNSRTNIGYSIPQQYGNSDVRLNIYDLKGRTIETLVNENQVPGKHIVSFDASNIPSGIYLYGISINGNTETKKMTLVK